MTCGCSASFRSSSKLITSLANPTLDSILKKPEFKTLSDLVTKFGLGDALTKLSGGTLYLPTNDAFQKISSVTATLTDDQLKSIVLYHVSTQQISDQGNTVLCSLSPGKPLLASKKMVNNVMIFRSKKTNQNNDVNVIDTVLLPFDTSSCSVPAPVQT